MGLTLHGIKYPEMTDLPNVPDDIGGIAKLNQSTQTWFSHLDTANLGKISAMNTRCATAEGSITTLNTGITTATNRQNAQQLAVNAVTSRNDSVNTRLNTRDTTLASDQSNANGFSGQATSLNTQKGRGFIGYANLFSATNVPHNGGYIPFGHITFNDPAPNANRVYRGFISVTLQVPGAGGDTYALMGLAGWVGTTWPGGVDSWVTQTYSGTHNKVTLFLDYTFTGMSTSQWTLWASILANSGYDFTIGAQAGDFMTLEDIGLQL